MKIYQEFHLLDYPGIIDFIYKIKDNIYIYKNNTLLELKYFQNNITLENSKKEKNTLFSLNNLYNLFLEKNYPKLYNKIKINFIKNKIIPKIPRKSKTNLNPKFDYLSFKLDLIGILMLSEEKIDKPIFQKKIKMNLY